MFATVGFAVEKVSGKTWEEFVKEKIFDPIGMGDSNFQISDSKKMPDYGLPYKHSKEKEIVPAEFMELGAPGPAGSINSTANDMTKWMKLQLGSGAIGDTRVISEELLKEMHTPHMHYNVLPFELEEEQFPSLGLGWFTEVYRGSKIIHHGGNVTGFSALCALLPGENLGVCILANMNSTFITYALRNEIFDRALGFSGGDWDARYKEEIDKLYAKMDEGKDAIAASRIEGTKPTLEMDAYVGEYEHPGYGVIEVKRNGSSDGFAAVFNGKENALKHYHYDQFLLVLDRFDAEIPSRFAISVTGGVESLGVPFEGELGKEIIFMRKVAIEEEGSKEKEG